jgi:hypothetical protein
MVTRRDVLHDIAVDVGQLMCTDCRQYQTFPRLRKAVPSGDIPLDVPT